MKIGLREILIGILAGFTFAGMIPVPGCIFGIIVIIFFIDGDA